MGVTAWGGDAFFDRRAHSGIMAGIIVRRAREDDLRAMADITNHYIRTSACTMKEVEELPEAMVQSFRLRSEGHPLLVAERNGEIVGWGDLSPHSERSAYRFTVHDAVYVRHDLRGSGIGTALLAALISSARELGYHSVVAVITASQTPSLDLHRRFGFVDSGRLRQAGFKFGGWEDVVTMQLVLRPTADGVQVDAGEKSIPGYTAGCGVGDHSPM